jgi:hypothetical protein
MSPHDADGFASRFGYHVEKGEFAEGLEFLLSKDEWRARGEAGYEYVRQTHEVTKVVDRHIAEYEALLDRAQGRS